VNKILKLKQVAGKPTNIEINERSLEEYRQEFAKKGLVITKKEEYPREDFYLVKKLKQFDALVDPPKGIKKVIQSMVRQPITEFDSKGKAIVKDALYYNGHYYGKDKRDNDIGAEFHEGSYKKPKLVFNLVDPDRFNTHLLKNRTQGFVIVKRYCSEHVPTP